ncbi:endonuclease domain-containing protein [Sphingomonas arenae]|uniref:endonuclease domain-containing protein n=1 Tax=Sphingomonas arenae TaxID=2812555 RepID=UPI001F2F2497|nr:endonuclease domain-containing protein [Sphingomonas arenae]
MTAPEVRLWSQLRTRPLGFKFRRQHPCGPFVFDFFCREAGLAIEIDGFAHETGNRYARDQQRDEWSRQRGIATLRYTAREVGENLEGVVAHVLDLCAQRTPPPPSAVPLPAKARGG